MVTVSYDSVCTTNKAIAVVLEAFIDFMVMRPPHGSFGSDDLCVIRQIDPSFVVPNATFGALVFYDAHDECDREASDRRDNRGATPSGFPIQCSYGF